MGYETALSAAIVDAVITLDVRRYGDITAANASTAFQSAIAAAGAQKAIVEIPPGTYTIDNVGTPANVTIRGLGAAPARFAPGGVILKHLAGSTNPDLVLNGAGNSTYHDVFVDNCGLDTLPGVLISSNSQAINTLDLTGLTIERCKGVHLQIGSGTNTVTPEFLRLLNLHIAAVDDNGGVANSPNVPLIHLKHGRSISLINPFIYGCPGPLIRHEQVAAPENTLGGLTIMGGTLLGHSAASGSRPERLIDLVSGNEFSMSGTRLDESGAAAIRIGAG